MHMNALTQALSATATLTMIAAQVAMSDPADAAPRAKDPCRQITQAECGAAPACRWRSGETWTRKEDGKEREVKAACIFDPTRAKGYMLNVMAPQPATGQPQPNAPTSR